ncbi:phage tail assembly chaperone [Vibrio parahaemolyticus]|nr:phage tail assembly chaperone [Vibrio parahaemolyticus]
MKKPQAMPGMHPDIQWNEIRNYRDYLIAQSDFSQMSDSQLTDEKKAEFAVYRQELRDIPQNVSDPDDVVWPVKPTI